MIIITDDNYVEIAEKAIRGLKNKTDERGRQIEIVTTSKIRNILAMAAEIYNEVIISTTDQLSEEVKSRIQYLRVRILYEAGRDKSVKAFVAEGKLLEILQSIGGTKKEYLLFNHYLEALVAYHRYFDGKD